MIEVEGLTKRYGEITAIEDVSFKVERGEILGFLGPNAAGKTTTMRILCGFLSPNRGSASVAGYDVLENSKEVRKKIGYMPEFPPLYPEMTVKSYLSFVSKLKGVPSSERKDKIKRVMGRVSIEEVEDRLVGNLSKGYKQRVGLAQAIIHDPDVLVLDEPTIGLDPKQIIEIRELIKGLGGEHTIILSTHILPEVTMTCQRVVIIRQGNVVAEDTLEGLSARLRRSNKVFVKILSPPSDAVNILKSIDSVMDVMPEDNQDGFVIESHLEKDIRPLVAKKVVDEGWGLVELRPLSMSLEDVFLELTTEEIEN